MVEGFQFVSSILAYVHTSSKLFFGATNFLFVADRNHNAETESSLFVKKLLAVSISNLAYLRGLFNESAFGGMLSSLGKGSYLRSDCHVLLFFGSPNARRSYARR